VWFMCVVGLDIFVGVSPVISDVILRVNLIRLGLCTSIIVHITQKDNSSSRWRSKKAAMLLVP